MKAIAVIGANYGDEGKGLMVDYFARQMRDALVVRFNGGAQAGHTVVDPDNVRHVFHHFGSGTLAGNPTYLSKCFVLNPFLFVEELQKALEFLNPTVYVDSRCPVTTHYDIAMNHILELRRVEESGENGRHGSCGIGINETIVRSEQMTDSNGTPLQLFHWIYHDKEKLFDKIQNYFLERIGNVPRNEKESRIYAGVFSEAMKSQFIRSFNAMTGRIRIMSPNMTKCPIIFEGAQGLLLDQNNMQDFPHLTRSNTGIDNVLDLLATEFKYIKDVDVVYVTRPYLTRHGAGPLPNEQPISLKNNEKETNVTNEFQQHFRYAPFDMQQFIERTNADYRKAVKAYLRQGFTKRLAMTCLDQVTDHFPVIIGDQVDTISDIGALMHHYEALFDYKSYGPSSKDVVKSGWIK